MTYLYYTMWTLILVLFAFLLNITVHQDYKR